MQGVPATYLGRPVSKEHFRAFIYSATGKKLVNSWDDFQAHMSSGVWFATEDEAKVPVVVEEEKPEPRRRAAKKKEEPVVVEETPVINSEIHDGGEAEPFEVSVDNDPHTFEIKTDDFLSDARE